MQAATSTLRRVRKLPPLILHPFSDQSGAQKLAASSKATLVIEGLLPSIDWDREQLRLAMLDGRFCEISMLYYVGKDLVRWIEQCIEVAGRDPELRDLHFGLTSFAQYLIHDPPQAVKDKLVRWGVVDYKAIFERGIGLNNLFAAAPVREHLTDEFIENYYRYADQLYGCRVSQSHLPRIDPGQFDFDLYASGEYSRLLERQWSE